MSVSHICFFLVFALLSAVLFTGLDMMLPLMHTDFTTESIMGTCTSVCLRGKSNGAIELQAGRQLESDPVGSDYDRLLEKFVTRKRAYGRALDLNLILLRLKQAFVTTKKNALIRTCLIGMVLYFVVTAERS